MMAASVLVASVAGAGGGGRGGAGDCRRVCSDCGYDRNQQARRRERLHCGVLASLPRSESSQRRSDPRLGGAIVIAEPGHADSQPWHESNCSCAAGPGPQRRLRDGGGAGLAASFVPATPMTDRAGQRKQLRRYFAM
jgi:hypothetical protein